MIILIFSVERDRLRERDRLARAAMSVQAEQAAAGSGPDMRHHHHHHNHAHHHSNIHLSTHDALSLFRAPVRVNIFSIYSTLTIGETIFFRLFLHAFAYGDIDHLFSQISDEYSLVSERRKRYSFYFFFTSIKYSWRI